MSEFEERLNVLQAQIDAAQFELAELRKLDLREKVVQRFAAISLREQHLRNKAGKESNRPSTERRPRQVSESAEERNK